MKRLSEVEKKIVESLTGRSVLTVEPVVLHQPDLTEIADDSVTDVIYFGTFENNTTDPITAHFVKEDGDSIKTVKHASVDSINAQLNNRIWTYIEDAGTEGNVIFYGFKMTLAPHQYGPNLVTSSTDFSDPAWVVGHPGDWTLDGSGAEHDGGAGSGDTLGQEIVSETINTKYLITVVVEGMTQGTIDVGFGDTNMTQITASGTFSQVIETATDTDIIALTVSADFDGVIDSVSVQKQIS